MYDVVVVGAGPAGATAAAFLADSGLRVALLDKHSFPRDKVCGDAVSGKSVDVLRRLGLVERLQASDQVGSWGVTFSAPAGHEVAIPFTKVMDAPVAPGFVCARTVFDELIVRRAVEAGAELFEGIEAEDLIRTEDGRIAGIRATSGGSEDAKASEFRAPLVIGADGAYSVVARSLGMTQLDEDHYCAGLRVYYEGVTGFHPKNHVELHFVDEAIPGYFWIFPMAGGRANVGVGMLSSVVKRKGVRLRPLLDSLIGNPRFRDRFAEASRISPVRGWGLPMGSKLRPLSGDGWMLVGDAGSMIDPFTGEGIGNAMVAGELAARTAIEATASGSFDQRTLSAYDRSLRSYLSGELRLSHAMQRLLNWKWLVNTVIRKASQSEELAGVISGMFDSEEERQKLVSPLFYLKALAS